MRPELLNPLFAEVTALKGIGPGLAKPLERLGLARAVDVAFHLPTGFIDRVPREELDAADAGRIIAITLTAMSYRFGGSARAPAHFSRRRHRLADRALLITIAGRPGRLGTGWSDRISPMPHAR